MKFSLRHGVFETNSSSVHSICIATGKKIPLTIPETLYVEPNDYGWEHAVLSTPKEKGDYLYTAILILTHEKLLNKTLTKLTDWLHTRGCEITWEATSKKDFEDGQYFGHGIDHSYDEGLRDFVNHITKSPTDLCNFLFSDNSYIVTGNDNDDSDVDIREDYPHLEYQKGN